MKPPDLYGHRKFAREEQGTAQGTGDSQRATQKRAKKRPMAKRTSEHPALDCEPVGASALFTPNTASRPRPGEQSITLQRNGRLKSLEGQKTDAELQVTCTKERRRGSAQAAVMP